MKESWFWLKSLNLKTFLWNAIKINVDFFAFCFDRKSFKNFFNYCNKFMNTKLLLPSLKNVLYQAPKTFGWGKKLTFRKIIPRANFCIQRCVFFRSRWIKFNKHFRLCKTNRNFTSIFLHKLAKVKGYNELVECLLL